jgi:hypothetical protein
MARPLEPVFPRARSRPRGRPDRGLCRAAYRADPDARAGSEIAEPAEQIRQANEAAARDPAQVLETLTRHNATFSERDLDRYLAKHLNATAERATVKVQVLEHENLFPLYDRETGQVAGRFTTRQVREQEQRALADAAAIAANIFMPQNGVNELTSH